jgi:hypothetical protein
MNNSTSKYLVYESKMLRAGLFKSISEQYFIESALYPGSYIHISPSFYFKEVVYVDTDSKARKFFEDDSFKKLITERKVYSEDSELRFYPLNYQEEIPEKEGYFDLLISQYAGFVSRYCKKYLKEGGILVANNSHGDAGVAELDPDLSLIAVINYRNERFHLSTKNLEKYFIPKKQDINVTLEYLLSQKRGLGYTKTASHYVFQKKYK